MNPLVKAVQHPDPLGPKSYTSWPEVWISTKSGYRQSLDIDKVWKPLFLIAWCLLLPSVSATCYHDNNIVAADYTPCNATAVGNTHCCQNGHTCLDTGLCMVSYDTTINTGSCTDATWESRACFQKCPGALGALNTLYRCDDNQWCCSLGGNTPSCCQDPDVELFELNGVNNPSRVMGGSAFVPGYTIAPIAALETTKPGISSSSTSNPSKACSASASNQSEACPASGDDVTKVGLGAGLGIGLPLTSALATLLFFLLREKRINRELKKTIGSPNLTSYDAKDNNVWYYDAKRRERRKEKRDPCTSVSDRPSANEKNANRYTNTARSLKGLEPEVA
ncbi:MAG: hypothetical protein Q9168_004765 [Polycauliona sp. 1 TL-2023]